MLQRAVFKSDGEDGDDNDGAGRLHIGRVGLIASSVAALRSEVRNKATAEDLRVTYVFLSEFTEYVIFLLLLLVVATNMNGINDAQPLVGVMRELILGDPPHAFDDNDERSTHTRFLLYEGVDNVEEMWDYMHDTLGEALFADDDSEPEERRFLLDGAHLKVGALRMVTARVTASWDACVELPVYRAFTKEPSIQTCFPRPSPDPESWSDEPFGSPPGYFEIDPSLIDERRLGRQSSIVGFGRRLLGVDPAAGSAHPAPRAVGANRGRGRRLRAGGGGDGGGRRDVSDGTGGETLAPEDRLFKHDLPFDMKRSQWEAEVDRLRRHDYVDRQTRVVELLFTVYNVASNLYCCVTLDLTMPFTGGVYGAATFYTVAPVRHLVPLTALRHQFPPMRTVDVFRLIAEILFLVLVARTIVWELRKARRSWSAVQSDFRKMDREDTVLGFVSSYAIAALNALQHVQFWSALQVASLVLHIVVLSRRAAALNLLASLDLAPEPGDFVDLHAVADLLYDTQNIVAINVLLSFLSLFKFATVVPHLSMLNRTIAVAWNDLVSFLFMFCVVFLGFMQAFQLSFGMDLLDFANAPESFYTLFATLSGDVNLDDLRRVNGFLGPLLFLLYAVLVVFVLLNMFVAIITSAYAQAKKELRADPQTGKLYNTIRYTTSSVVRIARKQYKFLSLAIRSRKTQREINQAMKDGVVTISELREIIRRSGLATPSARFVTWRYWANVDLVMTRYDPDGNGWLSKEELALLERDMAAESAERRAILERDFSTADEETRVEIECARRKRVYTALNKKVESLANQHTELLKELESSREQIHAHLAVLTSRLWRVWEQCDVI